MAKCSRPLAKNGYSRFPEVAPAEIGRQCGKLRRQAIDQPGNACIRIRTNKPCPSGDSSSLAEAAQSCPTLLTHRVTPHTIRRTTAMHLLQSNVDLNMIRSWLGHASIETTHGYVEIDLEMKRKTLQSCEKLLPSKGKRGPVWQRDKDILSWLSKL